MSTLASAALSSYIARQVTTGQSVVFDEIILCNIPNLTANNLASHLTMPNSNQIVHRQVVSQVGFVNENAVVYSVTMGTEIGDFDFNYIGLINRQLNLLAVGVYTNTIKKIKNKNGIQGNAITRSILLEFANAKQITNITIPAQTWQIDFTTRLTGIDEKIRLTNRDLYGRAVFFDDSFLVKRKTGNQFSIQGGVAYIEGVRASITNAQNITASLPCSIYIDVVHHCTVTGAYQTDIKFLKQNQTDYVDSAGYQHYVQILADIASDGTVTDRRLLSPFMGIKPKDLDENSESTKDNKGHAHKLPVASLLKKGITKLYSGVDSDSEEMAATPKTVKEIYELANGKQSPATTLAGYGITDSITVDDNFINTSLDTLLENNIVWSVHGVSHSITGLPSNAYNYGVGFNLKSRSAIASFYVPHDHSSQGKQSIWLRTHYLRDSSLSQYQPSPWVKLALANDVADLTGSVAFFACATAPNGWLKANGAAVSRTTYSDLFARIGTTFGAGDGRTTFNLPDLRAEFIRGLDDGRNIDIGRRLGSTQKGSLMAIDLAPNELSTSIHGLSMRKIDGINTPRDLAKAAGFDLTNYSDVDHFYQLWVAKENGRDVRVDSQHAVIARSNSDSSVGNGHINGFARPRNIALLACIKY